MHASFAAFRGWIGQAQRTRTRENKGNLSRKHDGSHFGSRLVSASRSVYFRQVFSKSGEGSFHTQRRAVRHESIVEASETCGLPGFPLKNLEGLKRFGEKSGDPQKIWRKIGTSTIPP